MPQVVLAEFGNRFVQIAMLPSEKVETHGTVLPYSCRPKSRRYWNVDGFVIVYVYKVPRLYAKKDYSFDAFVGVLK